MPRDRYYRRGHWVRKAAPARRARRGLRLRLPRTRAETNAAITALIFLTCILLRLLRLLAGLGTRAWLLVPPSPSAAGGSSPSWPAGGTGSGESRAWDGRGCPCSTSMPCHQPSSNWPYAI
ncbi:hypothetical protein GCM10020000_11380 [Streptomyces olivoverticillatus]